MILNDINYNFCRTIYKQLAWAIMQHVKYNNMYTQNRMNYLVSENV